MSSDPRRHLGVERPRDPIAGTTFVPKRTRLRRCGDENGWSFKYRGGDYQFTKNSTVLTVPISEGYICDGILFRDLTKRERGLSVPGERVWDVLRGVECICSPFTDKQWELGLDETYDPKCPVHNVIPESREAHAARGLS